MLWFVVLQGHGDCYVEIVWDADQWAGLAVGMEMNVIMLGWEDVVDWMGDVTGSANSDLLLQLLDGGTICWDGKK